MVRLNSLKPSKPSFLTLDTLDDRREIISLLANLSPVGRVRFLAQSCELAKRSDGVGPKPVYAQADIDQAYRCDRADTRLTNAVYYDLIALSVQWGVDLRRIAVSLESIIRSQRAGSIS